MSARHRFTCRECGREFKSITNSHLKTHNMTTTEYKNKYPGERLSDTSWLDSWRQSDDNKKHLIEQLKATHLNEDIENRRISSVRETWSNSDVRSRQSERMKEVVGRNPEKFNQLFQTNVTDRMRMSNYDRWVKDYGEEIANEKMKSWKENNKIPHASKNTKPEMKCLEKLEELHIEYVQQFSGIGKYWCDFYLPFYNLIIEVDGDYWHANPEKHKAEDLIGPRMIEASKIWAHDDEKSKAILSSGFKLLRVYASRMKTISTKKFYEDIVQASKKLEE